MTVHLGELALYTGASPVPHIFYEPMPHKLGRHQLLQRLPTRVGEAMDDIEHAAPPTNRKDGTGLSGGDVTQECWSGAAKPYVVQPQFHVSRPVSLDVRVCRLSLCLVNQVWRELVWLHSVVDQPGRTYLPP